MWIIHLKYFYTFDKLSYTWLRVVLIRVFTVVNSIDSDVDAKKTFRSLNVSLLYEYSKDDRLTITFKPTWKELIPCQ